MPRWPARRTSLTRRRYAPTPPPCWQQCPAYIGTIAAGLRPASVVGTPGPRHFPPRPVPEGQENRYDRRTGRRVLSSHHLTTSYIPRGDVQIIGLPADRIVSALLSGEVDAASVFPQTGIRTADRTRPNAALMDDPDIYVSTWNVAVTRAYAAANRPSSGSSCGRSRKADPVHPEPPLLRRSSIFWGQRALNTSSYSGEMGGLRICSHSGAGASLRREDRPGG